MTVLEARLSLERGIAPGLGLQLDASLRRVGNRIRFEDLDRQPFHPEDGDIHHRNETLLGITDPELLLHAGADRDPWSAAARVGTSLPLGRTEDNPFALGRLGIRHQHIQFGTGTWDPIIDAGLARRWGEVGLMWTGRARFGLYESRRGYRPGHRYATALRASRQLGSLGRGSLGVEVARENAERWNGRIEDEGNLGRTDALLAAGFVRPVGQLGFLGLDVRVPVRTWTEGEQLDYPVILALRWTR